MKPGQIETMLRNKSLVQPRLRVVRDTEPTDKLTLPDWHERKRISTQASALIVILCAAALAAGVAFSWVRTW